jgi:D-aminoacyl-tRNA deacylase
MRALVQRVVEARVIVADKVVGQIGPGLLVLVCAMRGDTESQAEWLAAKIAKLRVFSDTQGRMNLSLADTGGAALVVSQFTLAAETKGNRPGFSLAAAPEEGKRLYEHFAKSLGKNDIPVETGIFGAMMRVALVNDGPVTIWLDSAA